MDKTTTALLLEVCNDKGIDLTSSLKHDVEEVLRVMTEDVVLSGIRSRVETYGNTIRNLESRKQSVEKIDSEIDDVRRMVVKTNRDIEELTKLVGILKGDGSVKYPVQNKTLLDARMLAAGMVSDAVDLVGRDIPADVLCSIYQMASYVAWHSAEDIPFATKRGRG